MSTTEKTEKEYLIAQILKNMRRMSVDELQKLKWKTDQK